MDFVETCKEIFGKELQKVYDRERKEEKYLNADDYKTARERMTEGFAEASGQVVLFATEAACLDAKQRKNVDLSDEQKQVESELLPEYKELLPVTMSWWNTDW